MLNRIYKAVPSSVLLLLLAPTPLIFRPSSVSVTILQDSSEGAWSRVQRAQLTRNKRNCSLDWSHWIQSSKHFKIDFNSFGNSSDIIFDWNFIEFINRGFVRYYSPFFIRLLTLRFFHQNSWFWTSASEIHSSYLPTYLIKIHINQFVNMNLSHWKIRYETWFSFSIKNTYFTIWTRPSA